MKRAIVLIFLVLTVYIGWVAFVPSDDADEGDEGSGEDLRAGGPPHFIWDLSVGVNPPDPAPGQEVEAWARTEGHYSRDMEVYGVTIYFLDENKEVIQEHDVGNLTAPDMEKSMNTTFPETRPVYITAKVEDWDTPGMEFEEIEGVQYTDGEINELYQTHNKSKFTHNTTFP